MRDLYLALVHHPVRDREGQTVTTAITNLDLHDIARSCRTYGVERLFVVHPIEAQQKLARRIRDHWVHGSGRKRIPDRGTALEVISIVSDLEAAYIEVSPAGRAGVEVWTTAAKASAEPTPYADARALLCDDGPPVVLLFGTGWGLAEGVLAGADRRLEPIVGPTTYNHLSVRAAAAISLDRLCAG